MGNFLSRTIGSGDGAQGQNGDSAERPTQQEHTDSIRALNRNGMSPTQPSLVVGGGGIPMHFFLSIPVDNAAGAGAAGGGSDNTNASDGSASDGRRVSPRRAIENRSPSLNSNANANANANANNNSEERRQLVLVRVLSTPGHGGTNSNVAASIDSTRIEIENSSTTDNNAAANTISETENLTMYQWSIYFLTPTDAQSTQSGIVEGELAPTLQDQTVQRALLIVRSLLEGSGIIGIPASGTPTTEATYEDLLRLQERIGFVSRGVSKEEIEEALGTIPVEQANGTRCPICLADWLDTKGSQGQQQEFSSCRTLPCKHSYHTHCIDTWLCINNSCPECRNVPIVKKIGGGVKRSL